MKFASVYSDHRPTVVMLASDGGLVDLQDVDPTLPPDVRGLLELGPGALEQLRGADEKVTARLDSGTVKFRPVVPDPHAVWCTALNYRPHIAEGDWYTPVQPPFFLRVADSLCGHGEPLIRPQISDRLDYEGELAVIIGQPSRHVASTAAYDVIAGYSCFNDGSIRDWQRHTPQITAGKNFSATGAFGPWLTTCDEVPDIEAAELTTTLNGTTMQRTLVGELIFGIPKLVEYLSTVCELRPGDVIVTGTPGGVGGRQDPPRFMDEGDVIEVTIQGVGHLRNPVVREEDPQPQSALGIKVSS